MPMPSTVFTPLAIDTSGGTPSDFRSAILERRSTKASTLHFLNIQGVPGDRLGVIDVCVPLHADAYKALVALV